MVLHLIGSWVTLAFGLWVTSAIVPGFRLQGFRGALVVSAVLGVLHFFVGWLLFGFFTIATLGLAWVFAFVTWWFVTAILLSVTDSLSDSLRIDSFRSALIASAVLSLLSAVRTFFLH
ncbi:MAG TPA: phage holin family protein [Polyangiaceae bacterium]|nr:phage holin family protein [Polyangiaceae bacterium]